MSRLFDGCCARGAGMLGEKAEDEKDGALPAKFTGVLPSSIFNIFGAFTCFMILSKSKFMEVNQRPPRSFVAPAQTNSVSQVPIELVCFFSLEDFELPK